METAPMTSWRLIAKVPQGKNREELEAQTFDGWNPWRDGFFQLRELDIVVPDPRDPSRRCHAHIYEVQRASWVTKFASLCLPEGDADGPDRFYYFYIPTVASTEGAFQAEVPKFEGYWRRSKDEESELPWPEPDIIGPVAKTGCFAPAALLLFILTNRRRAQ